VIFGPAFPKSRDEQRENLFRLFQRGFQAAAKQRRGGEVYRSSFELLGRLGAERWAQLALYPEETALIERFVRECGLPAEPGAVVQKSLLVHAAAATWRRILQGLSREALAPLFQVRGEEHLRAALAAGRGVMIAHCHTLFEPLFWSWLVHQDIAPGVTLGHWAWEQGRKPGDRTDPRRAVPEMARELHAASQTLRAGGLAHVFGDGVQGSRQTEIAFCNRRRGFRSTFAEMAVAAGASTLTVAVAMGADGRMAIEIEPPLADDAAAPRALRVERLVREYAGRLERRWQREPAQIPWGDMAAHLRFAPL
jgi:lauroyl/myristoyl acyltransferase